jgi:hypothetical protein
MLSVSGIVITLLWMAIILWVIRKFSFYKLPGLGPWHPTLAFVLKLAAAIVMWVVYTRYYGHRDSNDAFRYYDDAMVIRGLWNENREYFFRYMFGFGLEDPALAVINDKLHCWTASYSYGLTHDGQTMIRLHVLIGFLSGGHYAVHTLIMCLFSFTGLVAIYRTFHRFLTVHPLVNFVTCFILPSVVFWSSGVLKEAPLLFVFGLFVWHFMRLTEKFGWWRLLFALLLFVSCFYLKEYVIIAFIPGLLFLAMYTWFPARYPVVMWMAVLFICFLTAANAGYFFSGGDFLYVLAKKQGAFISVAEMVDAGSLVWVPEVTDTWHYLLNYPHAMALAYLRPMPWEAHSTIMWVAALENLFYVAILVLVIVRFRKPEKSQVPFLLMILSFVLVLGGIIGSVVPILGAVVRYRIVALPFLVIVCAACIRPWSSRVFEAWRGVKKAPAAQ